MSGLNWTFTMLGIAVSLIPMLFGYFQYFNKRGNPKAIVVKKSIFWGVGVLVVLYVIGLFAWVKPDVDLNQISADINETKLLIQKFKKENDISDTPAPYLEKEKGIGIPQVLREKLDKFTKYEAAGISFDPEIYFQEGLLYYNNDNYQKAIEKLRIAIKLKPEYLEAYHLLANSFYYIGKYDSSLQYSQVTLTIAKKNNNRKLEAYGLNAIGRNYRYTKNFDQALYFHQQALSIYQELQLTSGEASTLNNIGLIYTAKKDHEKAAEAYKRALILHRENGNKKGEIKALTNIGVYYIAIKKPQDAIKSYQQVLEIAQQNDYHYDEAGSYINLGALFYDTQKNAKKAIECFEKALTISQKYKFPPIEANALHNIGHVYEDQGKSREALDFFLKALPIFRSTRGLGYGMGSSVGGVKSSGIKTYRNEVNTLIGIGNCYKDLGRIEDAIRFTEEILRIDSTYAEAYYNLGCYYSRLDSVDKALGYLSKGRSFFSEALINGSRTDSDLDKIRSNSRFKKIMYGE